MTELVSLSFSCYDDHRDLHVRTHSFPTRRSSELHLAFSPVTVEGEGADRLLGLAPLAVLPPWQGRGIGSALVGAGLARARAAGAELVFVLGEPARSEEHTSELQSLMRISYAVFCLKKKKKSKRKRIEYNR